MVSQVNGETSTVRASFGLRTKILVCADVSSHVPVIHHKLLRLTTAVSQQDWSKRVQHPIPRPQETSEEVLASLEFDESSAPFCKSEFQWSGLARVQDHSAVAELLLHPQHHVHSVHATKCSRPHTTLPLRPKEENTSDSELQLAMHKQMFQARRSSCNIMKIH